MNAELLNVRVRRATAADAEDVSRWRNQPTSLRFQASSPRSVEQVRELLAAQEQIEINPEAEGKLYWIIEVDRDPAGQIQIAVDGGFRQQLMSTLGYTVTETMQGRGVATAAVREAIRIAFGPLGLERIEAVAAVENLGSRTCSREGRLPVRRHPARTFADTGQARRSRVLRNIGYGSMGALMESGKKRWAGRFASGPDARSEAYTASIGFDTRLIFEDLRGSVAHVRMLGKQGIIAPGEAAEIERGLWLIWDEAEAGTLEFTLSDEDVHSGVERRLRELIGPVQGKLHTGRSRNDQVINDVRLWTKRAVVRLTGGLVDLIEALLGLAGDHVETIMPGFTHTQRAQPVTLGHHLLAYVSMFERDVERFQQAYARMDRSALGASAMAGTTYPIDRAAVAQIWASAALREQHGRDCGSRSGHRYALLLRDGCDALLAPLRGAGLVVVRRDQVRDLRRRLCDRQLDHAAEERIPMSPS